MAYLPFELHSRNMGAPVQYDKNSKVEFHPSLGCVEDSDSDTGSIDSQDCFEDSYMSSSSISSGPDEDDCEDLTSSLTELKCGFDNEYPPQSKMFNKNKSDVVEDMLKYVVSNPKQFDLGHIIAAPLTSISHSSGHRVPEKPNMRRLVENNPKATGNLVPDGSQSQDPQPSAPLTSEEIIQLKSLQARYKAHGSGKAQDQGRVGVSGNPSRRSSRVAPPQVPPYHWGKSGQKNRDKDEEEEEDERPEGVVNNSPTRQRRGKKFFACPGAKGDPFRNRDCLRSTFPNLAKTRQHLACGTHFRVGSTTHLPDAVKDPNGWEDIMKFIYPNQEVPSSDPDFDKILDVIAQQGAGQGKPDFLSHMTRMIRKCMEDEKFGQETLALFEAIDGESKPQPAGIHDEMDHSPTHKGEESKEDYDFMEDYRHLLPPQPHPPHIQPEPIMNFESTSNTPPVINPAQSPGFSSFSPPQQYIYSPVTPTTQATFFNGILHPTTSINPNQYPITQHPSAAILRTAPMPYMNVSSFADRRFDSSGPDSNHQPQIGSNFQMNIPGPPDPAPAPPPDRQPEIRVKFPTRDKPFIYNQNDNAAGFENWLLELFPHFSFNRYKITCTRIRDPQFSEMVDFARLTSCYRTYLTESMSPSNPFTLEISVRSRPSYMPSHQHPAYLRYN